MIFRLISTAILVMVLLVPMNGPEARQEGSVPSSRYMGGPAELVTAPNGAIVNKEVLEESPKTYWTEGPEIENPVEGVYVLGGYLISACIVVEADEGLIVFDTGDTKKDGEKLLKAIRTFSDKPIKAIVYGELSFQTPAIYYHTVGWWDGDGATIFRPSPEEAAERIVSLIGGRDKVLKEAEKAYEKKEADVSFDEGDQVRVLRRPNGEARVVQ